MKSLSLLLLLFAHLPASAATVTVGSEELSSGEPLCVS